MTSQLNEPVLPDDYPVYGNYFYLVEQLLPDCMMPDGAEPCAAYTKLRASHRRLLECIKILVREHSDPGVEVSSEGYSDPSFDLCGLTPHEAQYAIRHAAMEKKAAQQRRYKQRKAYEAGLRRQGYDEEYIKTH
jgi:hypothetical protein